jgi:hypothetical protein
LGGLREGFPFGIALKIVRGRIDGNILEECLVERVCVVVVVVVVVVFD